MPVGPLRTIGKKHVQLASMWMGSGLVFGMTAGVAITWGTEWKTVLQYLPLYNGKYSEQEA